MMRFVVVAAVAAVGTLVIWKLVTPRDLATNGQLEKRPVALALSQTSKSEGFGGTTIAPERPAPLASEHAIDKEPPKRPGERAFVIRAVWRDHRRLGDKRPGATACESAGRGTVGRPDGGTRSDYPATGPR